MEDNFNIQIPDEFHRLRITVLYLRSSHKLKRDHTWIAEMMCRVSINSHSKRPCKFVEFGRIERRTYDARCTLHAARCTLHAARCTLHAARCTLHAARCTLRYVVWCCSI
jgi:hypothetical protein